MIYLYREAKDVIVDSWKKDKNSFQFFNYRDFYFQSNRDEKKLCVSSTKSSIKMRNPDVEILIKIDYALNILAFHLSAIKLRYKLLWEKIVW